MQGIQVGEKLVLSDERVTDRGPIVMVKAVVPGYSDPKERMGAHHNYGVSVKMQRDRYNTDVFECYLGDFSDASSDTRVIEGKSVKYRGWMEFVNPGDRKKWEEFMKAKAQKAKA
jgi:hypothetical protein